MPCKHFRPIPAIPLAVSRLLDSPEAWPQLPQILLQTWQLINAAYLAVCLAVDDLLKNSHPINYLPENSETHRSGARTVIQACWLLWQGEIAERSVHSRSNVCAYQCALQAPLRHDGYISAS